MDFTFEQQPSMFHLGELGNDFLHSIVHFLLVVDAHVGADVTGAESLDQNKIIMWKN